MALQTAPDVPLLINSPNASSERRITPSWTIAQLKTRLEPITGIPPGCQRLTLTLPGREPVPLAAADEDEEERVQVGGWGLVKYAEINVGTFVYENS